MYNILPVVEGLLEQAYTILEQGRECVKPYTEQSGDLMQISEHLRRALRLTVRFNKDNPKTTKPGDEK